MADAWETFQWIAEGGLVENIDRMSLASTAPGAAQRLVNFEPSLDGGYRRIKGSAKYSPVEVPGTGNVLGVFAFEDRVVAARSGDLYWATQGSGWTLINTLPAPNPVRYRAAKYNWAYPTLVLVDGTNKPVKYQPLGSSFTELTDAEAGCTCIEAHGQYLFTAKGSNLQYSAPSDDTKWSAANGGGVINVGFSILQIRSFRDELYVFGRQHISKISGRVASEFQLVPVTDGIGTMAADSVQEIGGFLVFLAPDGVRPIAGTNRINDIEIESISRPVQQRMADMVATANAAGANIVSTIVRSKSQYRLFAATPFTPASALDLSGNPISSSPISSSSINDGITANDPNIAYGLLMGARKTSSGNIGYEWAVINGLRVTCVDSGYLGPVETIVHGATDGYIYQQEVGNTFNGAPISYEYMTPNYHFGDPSVRKVLHKMELQVSFLEASPTNIPDLNMQTVLDAGYPIEPMQPSDIILNTETYSSGSYVLKKNIEGSGFTAAFRFYGNDSNCPFSIRAGVVQYNPESRI